MESDGSGFNVARLDKSLRHLPEPALRGTGGTCCALCRFVTGMKCTAHLLKCTDCGGVALCMFCFKNFHEIDNLVAAKDRLCQEWCERTGKAPNPNYGKGKKGSKKSK